MNATSHALDVARPEPVASTVAPDADRPGGAHWVIDPTIAGDDLPARGRSLFDFLVTQERAGELVQDVPFPFTALVRRVAARMGRESRSEATKGVLIPLGRSLQRNSAAPDYFASPRAVVAALAEPAGTGDLYLKDRLYLGYQEKANVIEVISYNEDAGRFEFQVVTDYRAGGTPRVAYANRTLCVACHQNAAPIFSRAVWDETNANPHVAALLGSERKELHGIPLDRGVDVPNAIDDATLRANGFAAYQLVWADGCGGNDEPAVRCRASLFAALLQYRLSGQQQFDRADASYRNQVVARLPVAARWQWPNGLAIGNPDLPNRNPVPADTPMSRAIALRDGASLAHVAPAFDPLLPRPPLEVWRIAGQDAAARLVIGLADFIAEPDVERLDKALFRRAETPAVARRSYRSTCVVEPAPVARGSRRIEFRCASLPAPAGRGVSLEGRLFVVGRSVSRGAIDRLEIDGQPALRDLDVDARPLDARGAWRAAVLTPWRGRLHARGADGNVLERIELRWGDRDGTASVVVLDDFAAARDAIDALARDSLAGKFDGFNALAFRRARLMPAILSRLGTAAGAWCCLDASGMPPARAARIDNPERPGGEAVKSATAASHADFYRYCAECHLGAERAPPNFLLGDADEVEAKIRHCAPRIFFRLSMWHGAPEARAKTPMPPEIALRRFKLADATWRDGGALASLILAVSERLRAEAGGAQGGDALLAQSYESLRACLPGDAAARLPAPRLPQTPDAGPARHTATLDR